MTSTATVPCLEGCRTENREPRTERNLVGHMVSIPDTVP